MTSVPGCDEDRPHSCGRVNTPILVVNADETFSIERVTKNSGYRIYVSSGYFYSCVTGGRVGSGRLLSVPRIMCPESLAGRELVRRKRVLRASQNAKAEINKWIRCPNTLRTEQLIQALAELLLPEKTKAINAAMTQRLREHPIDVALP